MCDNTCCSILVLINCSCAFTNTVFTIDRVLKMLVQDPCGKEAVESAKYLLSLQKFCSKGANHNIRVFKTSRCTHGLTSITDASNAFRKAKKKLRLAEKKIIKALRRWRNETEAILYTEKLKVKERQTMCRACWTDCLSYEALIDHRIVCKSFMKQNKKK